MYDNPIHTFFQFLTGDIPDQLSLGNLRWFTVALYWAILLGSFYVFSLNWRRDPSQRTIDHVSIYLMRVLAAGMWYLGTLWKLPWKSIYDGRRAALGIGYRYFHQLVARHIGFARDRFSDRPTASPVPPSSYAHQTRPTKPADSNPVQRVDGAETTDRTPKENNDGPKAPPRPRGFVRLPGLPDDNKDYLIGPADDPHDAAAKGRRR